MRNDDAEVMDMKCYATSLFHALWSCLIADTYIPFFTRDFPRSPFRSFLFWWMCGQ